MKSEIKCRCFGKINLFLKVLDLRHDGYHNIETVFQSISLHDTLTITPTDNDAYLTCDDPQVPQDSSNLVLQAAELYSQRSGKPCNYHFHLEKKIPTAAGLGGGSSDAAACLNVLNLLHKQMFTDDQLKEIALQIGSDVPYFLVGGTAIGTGRGEQLNPVADMPKTQLLLVSPAFSVKASEAYQEFDLTRKGKVSDINLPDLYHEASSEKPLRWYNDLQWGVFARYPELEQIRNQLLDQGIRQVVMSGSGPVLVAEITENNRVEQIAKSLKNGEHNIILADTLGRNKFINEFIIAGDDSV